LNYTENKDQIIGIIGLGKIGYNVAKQFEKQEIKLAVYDSDENKLKRIKNCSFLIKAKSIKGLVKLVTPPRLLLIFLPSDVIDKIIPNLLTVLEPFDILVDAGNSHFKDTELREKIAKSNSVRYLGVGMSGGIEGAKNGLCMMVGGSNIAYKIFKKRVSPILWPSNKDHACLRYGSGGAGHLAKIIHNGVEYAKIQLISEIYNFCFLHKISHHTIQYFFDSINLNSYLLSCAIKTLSTKDESSGGLVLDNILGKSESNGTGLWSFLAACEYNVYVPSISSAVDARNLDVSKKSYYKYNRLSKREEKSLLDQMKFVYLFSEKIIYSQGIDLLISSGISQKIIQPPEKVLMNWKAGSIIRSDTLNQLIEKLQRHKKDKKNTEEKSFLNISKVETDNVLEFIKSSLNKSIPIPLIISSYNYYLCKENGNRWGMMTQAIRDVFGGHGFYTKNGRKRKSIKWKSN
tara:strand:+ start:118891 stop:120270 length:1380 start_codon:yes stop_codon:yes gene_type:complete